MRGTSAWPRATRAARCAASAGPGRSPRPARCRRRPCTTSATARSAENMALSAGRPRPPDSALDGDGAVERGDHVDEHPRAARRGGPVLPGHERVVDIHAVEGLGPQAAHAADASGMRSDGVPPRRAVRLAAMSPTRRHGPEVHRSNRSGWLRAAVLGADDGIVSTASLIVGVAGSGAEFATVRTAGIAGLFVAARCRWRRGSTCPWRPSATPSGPTCTASARSSATTRRPSWPSWRGSGATGASTRSSRGAVAAQLTEADALAAHARDELGLTEEPAARPVQAALTSAARLRQRRALPAPGLPRRAPTAGRSAVVIVRGHRRPGRVRWVAGAPRRGAAAPGAPRASPSAASPRCCSRWASVRRRARRWADRMRASLLRGEPMTRTAFRTCPLCEAGCGLEITLRDTPDGEEVTRIRGDRDDVFSHGLHLPQGLDAQAAPRGPRPAPRARW